MRYVFTMLMAGFVLITKAQNADYLAYIRQYATLAMQEQNRTGIPASITLAQGLLESGAGKGNLVMRSNNHFGIKCKNTWTGATALHDDDARNECFRAYPSAEDSYRDHSDFLKNNTRYAALFNYAIEDYQAWAHGLKKAGYATNPRYPQMLIKVIEEYQLHSYTLAALRNQEPPMADVAVATPELSTPANGPAQTTAANNLADQQTLVQATPDNVHLQRTVADTRIQPYPDGVFAINGLKVVFAKKGSSLLALAARHGITMGQLLQFNEMARQDILDQDQLVFLERKKKTGSAKEHEVQPGETIWSISQQYGMQSNQLMNLNNLVSNISLQVGMKLQLQ